MRYSAHAVRVLLALVVVALGLLTGCDQNPSTTGPYDPQGGVDASKGGIIADDVWIDAPNGVAAGGSAWMRLTLTNETKTGDALVGVSSPEVRHTSLELAGKPVERIDIPAGESVDLEWGRGSGVKLDDFRGDVKAGQTWFDITLTFADSPPITMTITAGQLAS